jgi:hypothetical protein
LRESQNIINFNNRMENEKKIVSIEKL